MIRFLSACIIALLQKKMSRSYMPPKKYNIYYVYNYIYPNIP